MGGRHTMTVTSLFTGARVNFIAYRLCPVIFTLSAVFIVLGARLV
jgi:hypothetical protein